MFLRLYEKKTKFKHLLKKGHETNEMQKDVLSCVEIQYNGFDVTRCMCEKEQQLEFQSIDIVFKPVKHIYEIIKCYCTNGFNQTFIAKYQTCKNDKIHTTSAYICYYCKNYCISKKIFDKHLKICARKPGIVYSFNKSNLSTFEDNFRLMGDQPFSIYFDFETTCCKDKFVFTDHEDHLTDMYVVSYCLVVIFFSPKLLLGKNKCSKEL